MSNIMAQVPGGIEAGQRVNIQFIPQDVQPGMVLGGDGGGGGDEIGGGGALARSVTRDLGVPQGLIPDLFGGGGRGGAGAIRDLPPELRDEMVFPPGGRGGAVRARNIHTHISFDEFSKNPSPNLLEDRPIRDSISEKYQTIKIQFNLIYLVPTTFDI